LGRRSADRLVRELDALARRSACGLSDTSDHVESDQHLMADGRLKPEAIQQVVRSHFNEFRLCSDNALRYHSNLQGRVVLPFVIQPDGSVSVPSVGGNPVIARVIRVLEGVCFPPFRGGPLTVHYPIVFAP
jgi:hypothetical protein